MRAWQGQFVWAETILNVKKDLVRSCHWFLQFAVFIEVLTEDQNVSLMERWPGYWNESKS